MKLARVTGLVTGTIKDNRLAGQKLLVVDVVDGAGAVLEPALVATDVCGAGPGETVLVAFGSAARLPADLGTVPTDATIVAIVDEVKIDGAKSSDTAKPAKRKR